METPNDISKHTKNNKENIKKKTAPADNNT